MGIFLKPTPLYFLMKHIQTYATKFFLLYDKKHQSYGNMLILHWNHNWAYNSTLKNLEHPVIKLTVQYITLIPKLGPFLSEPSSCKLSIAKICSNFFCFRFLLLRKINVGFWMSTSYKPDFPVQMILFSCSHVYLKAFADRWENSGAFSVWKRRFTNVNIFYICHFEAMLVGHVPENSQDWYVITIDLHGNLVRPSVCLSLSVTVSLFFCVSAWPSVGYFEDKTNLNDERMSFVARIKGMV